MSPATNRRTRDPERSRRQILDAARDEFVEHGVAGARTSRIAKAADVPQGLLYHYFENKERLFDAVMEDAMAPYFDGLMNMLKAADRPEKGLLERSVRQYFHFLAANVHVTRLYAWWMADKLWSGEPLTDKAGHSEAVQLLGAQRIREGQEAGHIRPDLEPVFVIKSFIDLCMMWHMTRGQKPMSSAPELASPAMDDAYLEHLVTVFMHGVAVRTDG